MSVNKTHVKTFTFEVQPYNEKLLDQLMERYVIPILDTNTEARKVVQGSKRKRSTLSPEEELDKIFEFTGTKPTRDQLTDRNIAQASLGTETLTQEEIERIDQILEFTGQKKMEVS